MAPVGTGTAPLPVATQGVPAAASPPAAQPAASASQNAPTGFNPVPAGQPGAASGGGFAQEVGNSFSRLAQYAQQQMNNVQTQISSIFNSEGGQVDGAKLAALNQQMSTFSMMMEQAAELQRKQEQAARAWIGR